MVLDTSAIIAIVFDEPERDSFLTSLEADPIRLVSAVTLVEVEMVFSRIRGEAGVNRLELFLSLFHVRVISFDVEQAMFARDGFLRYGKGRHKAGLNFGDCMTYALAKQTGEPLLFKGDDFGHTDLRFAWESPIKSAMLTPPQRETVR